MGVGAVLYLHHRLTYREADATAPEPAIADEPAEECCGMHITCERDSLSPVFAKEVEYFDDEELDAYADTDPADYPAEAVEQFRDVLLTLRPDDIAPWARSIQQRRIALPDEVRDELFIIVNEARMARVQS